MLGVRPIRAEGGELGGEFLLRAHRTHPAGQGQADEPESVRAQTIPPASRTGSEPEIGRAIHPEGGRKVVRSRVASSRSCLAAPSEALLPAWTDLPCGLFSGVPVPPAEELG